MKSVKREWRKTPTYQNDAILAQLIMLGDTYLGEHKPVTELMPISLWLM